MFGDTLLKSIKMIRNAPWPTFATQRTYLLWQRLWLSWQHNWFQYQRSAVWIQSSSKCISIKLEKTKIIKEAGNDAFKKFRHQASAIEHGFIRDIFYEENYTSHSVTHAVPKALRTLISGSGCVLYWVKDATYLYFTVVNLNHNFQNAPCCREGITTYRAT